MIPKPQREELARLHAEATAGPWKAGRPDMHTYNADGAGPFKYVYRTEAPPEEPEPARGHGERCVENAQLIAAMRNALPALLESAEFAEKALELLQSMDEVAKECFDCPCCDMGGVDVDGERTHRKDCGLAVFLSALPPRKGGA